jgi:hypothetical protein
MSDSEHDDFVVLDPEQSAVRGSSPYSKIELANLERPNAILSGQGKFGRRLFQLKEGSEELLIPTCGLLRRTMFGPPIMLLLQILPAG